MTGSDHSLAKTQRMVRIADTRPACLISSRAWLFVLEPRCSSMLPSIMTFSFDKPKANNLSRVQTISCLVALVAFSAMGLVACSGDDVQSSGGDTSSSSGGGGMALPAEGAVGDARAPNDGPALDFEIGVAVSCTEVPNGPQFRFYGYPGGTETLAVGQSWSFDAMTMGVMGKGWWYPDGVGGNFDLAQSGSLKVLSVATGTVSVHYEFVTSTGVKYAGDATLTVCSSKPACA
jgi:hypothetical protein